MEIDAERLGEWIRLEQTPPRRTDWQLADSRFELRQRWLDDETYELGVFDTWNEWLVSRYVARAR